MTPFEQKYADLGAQLHGGFPVRRTVPMPPPAIPQPAQPTMVLTVQGVELAPTERLNALAAIRDGHRGRARAASERAHDLYSRVLDEERRVQMIENRLQLGAPDERAAGELAVVKSQIEQLRDARVTAQAEADDAANAMAEAERLLHSAIRYAREAGAVVPFLLESEVR